MTESREQSPDRRFLSGPRAIREPLDGLRKCLSLLLDLAELRISNLLVMLGHARLGPS